MYDLTGIEVGDKVVHFYSTSMGGLSAVVYDVIRETPKRFIIKRGSGVEYQVDKKTGRLLGQNEYVKPVGEDEKQKILEIQERDRIRCMRRELVKALQERDSLSDNQVQRMYALLENK